MDKSLNAQSSAEQMEALVEEVIFRNEQNGFTVLQVRIGRERTSAVGVMPELHAGEMVMFTGEWVEHRDYGKQIKVEECQAIMPTTLVGIERYLGSGLIKGIGPATAKQIVRAFGESALEVLQYSPERLSEIPGIGSKRAQTIAVSYAEQVANRETMMFLQSCGLGPALSMKVLREYGIYAREVIRENPYKLVEEIDGIGFKTADGIALNMGIAKNSEYRLSAGIKYLINEAASSNGHTYLPREILQHEACITLECDEEMISNTIDALAIGHELTLRVYDDINAVYLPQYERAESDVARLMLGLVKSRQPEPIREIDISIENFESDSGFFMNEEQKQAVKTAMQSGMMILTGGPGTGKTTTINCLLRLLGKRGEVALCAPTGRAAKRMTETTGVEAKTIHRLLEYGGDEDSFQRNEDYPLEVSAIIVDEMSMVDLFLMRSLLRAIVPGTRVIFVGDADQLPSVGAGNVLKDMIDSGVIPVERLTEIFRQEQQSMIITNAHRINNGEPPVLNQKGGDFFIERQDSTRDIAETIVELCLRRLPSFMNIDKTKIQVLAPMKKGEAGVWSLNKLLQAKLNPQRSGAPKRNHGDITFYVNDKVMQIKNNYKMEWTRGGESGDGVFNGDMGIITHIDMDEKITTVLFDDEREVLYEDSQLDELELSYCVSVHKSQGSEFPAVVMPMVNGPPMLLTRNLLYTAVTRARQMVVLVGRESAINSMVRNNFIAKRYSALGGRLRLLFGI